jgi:hypothetical protein
VVNSGEDDDLILAILFDPKARVTLGMGKDRDVCLVIQKTFKNTL